MNKASVLLFDRNHNYHLCEYDTNKKGQLEKNHTPLLYIESSSGVCKEDKKM